jgi:hypothetical protein
MNVKSALVTCHAERPLEDEAWTRLLAMLERPPGRLQVIPLLRPPDRAAGEDEDRWLARARKAEGRGPIGLHTHWTSPSHARPSGGDPAGRVREEIAWMRDRGLAPRLFCGGGWYTDGAVQRVLAEERLVDCTATAFRPPVPEPFRIAEHPESGLLPTTHSPGMLVRAVLGPLPSYVHAYFHDTDLLDARWRTALVASLRLLGLRRRPFDVSDVEL